MSQTILESITNINRHGILARDLVSGLVRTKDVSSTAMARCISGEADHSSRVRRVERFFSDNYICNSSLVSVLQTTFGNREIDISIDRTNWEFGESKVNIFAAFGSSGDVRSLLDIDMLDNNGGSSSSKDRISLIDSTLKGLDIRNVRSVLFDREFFSCEFVSWLLGEGIPFAIRVKQNLQLIQPFFRQMKGMDSRIFYDICVGTFNGCELRCDLSIKKLKDEYLILVSHKVKAPLAKYRKRWDIETFFKNIKSNGFRIEDSKRVKHDRMEKLVLLCAIAYLICTVVGIYRHIKEKKIKIKKQKDGIYQNEYCFFRWGLDWIMDMVHRNINQLEVAISLAFKNF